MQCIKIYSNIYFTAFTTYGGSYGMIVMLLIVVQTNCFFGFCY